MRGGHEEGLWGTGNIPFLDLRAITQVHSFLDDSSIRTLRICVLFYVHISITSFFCLFCFEVNYFRVSGNTYWLG